METDELDRIRSGISQAYWCDTSDTITKFQAAELAFDTPNKQNISWFDKLFEGGISLPRGTSNILRPITMLVSGPPGCGKTTLISELRTAWQSTNRGMKKHYPHSTFPQMLRLSG